METEHIALHIRRVLGSTMAAGVHQLLNGWTGYQFQSMEKCEENSDGSSEKVISAGQKYKRMHGQKSARSIELHDAAGVG